MWSHKSSPGMLHKWINSLDVKPSQMTGQKEVFIWKIPMSDLAIFLCFHPQKLSWKWQQKLIRQARMSYNLVTRPEPTGAILTVWLAMWIYMYTLRRNFWSMVYKHSQLNKM